MYKNKLQKITVLVYNVNYWENDVSLILNNIKLFGNTHNDYKYN